MAGNAHARRHRHQKGCAMCERTMVIKRRNLGVKPVSPATPKKEKAKKQI